MQKNNFFNGKTVLTLTLIFAVITGFTALSFAGWGHGYGNHHGYGNQVNPNDVDYKSMVKQRDLFFEKVADIRRDLAENQSLLQAELTRETPDETKTKEIQKRISALRSQFDQIELAHVVEMKKISPEYASFCQSGMGHGMGYHAGNGMGHGMGNGMGYHAGNGMDYRSGYGTCR